MKLKISLTLALAARASSAFALRSSHGSGTFRDIHAGSDVPTAFVRPALSDHRRGADVGLRSTAVAAEDGGSAALPALRGGGLASVDVPLLIYFGLWYLGNYYYNLSNKLALKATGGAAGFPMTISALQLGIGKLFHL